MASSQVSLKVGSCSDLHSRAGPFDVDVVCSAYCRRARSTVSLFLTDMIPGPVHSQLAGGREDCQMMAETTCNHT